MIVEFRHQHWLSSQTMTLLREVGAAFCIVDLPDVKHLPASWIEATSHVAYLRFHGRNAAKWSGPATRNERYDYEYAEDELTEWVEPITNVQKYTDVTYTLFNNPYRGKAAKNAEMLKQMLKVPGRRGTTPEGALI